jgi:hypothetical protein
MTPAPPYPRDPTLLASIMEGYANFVLQDMGGLTNYSGWCSFRGRRYMQKHFLRIACIQSMPWDPLVDHWPDPSALVIVTIDAPMTLSGHDLPSAGPASGPHRLGILNTIIDAGIMLINLGALSMIIFEGVHQTAVTAILEKRGFRLMNPGDPSPDYALVLQCV